MKLFLKKYFRKTLKLYLLPFGLNPKATMCLKNCVYVHLKLVNHVGRKLWAWTIPLLIHGDHKNLDLDGRHLQTTVEIGV